jgi:hypothetical protein
MESQAGFFNGRVASNDGVCLLLTNSRRKRTNVNELESCSCDT